MGRPKGTKNKMRSPEEKEAIVLELLNGEGSSYFISRKYGISRSLLWGWVETYRNEGIDLSDTKSLKRITCTYRFYFFFYNLILLNKHELFVYNKCLEGSK